MPPRDDSGFAADMDDLRANIPSAITVAPGRLHEIATEAEQAITAAGLPVYQRGRRLVRPASQEISASKGRTTIAACFSDIGQAGALDYMSRAIGWIRFDAKGKPQTIDPPRQVADVLLARFGDWKFPAVSGIITCPTLRPDHSILSEPGYDTQTRLYYEPDPSLQLPSMPALPTKQDATEALWLLDGLLTGFPFVSPLDRSVALSALLTPVCRGAMSVAPLHAFRASTAGSGKSFLIDLASAVATGRPCPVVAAGRDADETDKRLVGLLLSGFPIVSVDNVNGELGSDLLCQAVERPVIRLRRLGASDISEIETRACVYANGNGLRVRGDMTRRTLVSDLDAEMERPELRTFAFDPVERVLADRGAYVAAVLTLVRGFVVSGEVPDMPPLASYADYTATVRGALVWLGRPDPAESMERAREDDPDLDELRDLMAHWLAYNGHNEATSKSLVRQADGRVQDDHGRQGDYANPDLREALLSIAGGRNGIDGAKFGRWLRSRKGRVVTLKGHRVRFETVMGTTDGVARWKLRQLQPGQGV